MFENLYNLPPAAPYDPVKFRGDVGRFLTPVNWIAVAGKYTWGGIKCKTEFGALIYGVEFLNSAGAVPGDAMISVGINLDAGTVVGIRRRDVGLDLYGNVKGAVAEAFIAQNATQLGSIIYRHHWNSISNPMTTPYIPLNWFLQNNEELVGGMGAVNQSAAINIWGVEFYTPEVRDYFLQRMK